MPTTKHSSLFPPSFPTPTTPLFSHRISLGHILLGSPPYDDNVVQKKNSVQSDNTWLRIQVMISKTLKTKIKSHMASRIDILDWILYPIKVWYNIIEAKS